MHRVLIQAAALAYVLSLRYAYVRYLSVEWEYFGFVSTEVSILDSLMMAVACLLTALALPLQIQRVSDMFHCLLYIIVVVPAIVITTSLGAVEYTHQVEMVVCLIVAFWVSALLARSRVDRLTVRMPRPPPAMPQTLTTSLITVWGIATTILLYSHREIVTFRGLDEVYVQRAAGSVERNSILAYTQLYLANVLSPALVTFGLFQRKIWLVVAGTSGCMLIYGITALRTAFALPFVLVGLWASLKSPWVRRNFVALSLSTISGVLLLTSSLYHKSAVSAFTSLYLTFRTIGIPGLAMSQYARVFEAEGYTWGSHIKGLSALLPTPQAYANDPGWPSLGYIVADRIYKSPETNLNASLYAGDGIASAGLPGIVLVSIMLGIWLRILNSIVPPTWEHVSIILLFPVALALTNAPLSTTFVSFGGAFWTVFFFYVQKYSHRSIRHMQRQELQPEKR